MVSYLSVGLEELSEEEELEEKGEKDKGTGEKNEKKKKGGKKGVSREKSFGLGMGAGVSGGRTSNFSVGQANYASYMHNEGYCFCLMLFQLFGCTLKFFQVF